MEKLIGFDATEDHRAKGTGGTYSTAKGLNLAPEAGMPKYGDRYDVVYPLREQGMTRSDCRAEIVNEGLPIPPKSACFLCPASKAQEVTRLAEVDPVYYLLSAACEAIYRTGKHFRGDDLWTVRGTHKLSGDRIKSEVRAVTSSEAIAVFRKQVKDSARPYAYKVATSPSVSGLLFGKPWMAVPATLPDKYRERLKAFLARRGHGMQIDNRSLPVLG